MAPEVKAKGLEPLQKHVSTRFRNLSNFLALQVPGSGPTRHTGLRQENPVSGRLLLCGVWQRGGRAPAHLLAHRGPVAGGLEPDMRGAESDGGQRMRCRLASAEPKQPGCFHRRDRGGFWGGLPDLSGLW